MAILHPFRALRPAADRVKEVASVPYDVVDTEEARQLAAGRPHSFLHVVRPEIDLPEGTSEYADEVYEKGAENLHRLRESEVIMQEERPMLYVYRLQMDDREQTGIFGCVGVTDYDQGTILKHEETRPAKEDDRTRHIVTQKAHAEPVMLTLRDQKRVTQLMQEATRGEPLYDFEADDGVQHTLWRATDLTEQFVEAFQQVDKLYVADGHHRCKAASRAAKEVSSEEAQFFPAVLLPVSQMFIMPYNRIIRELPAGQVDFLNDLRGRFDVELDVGNPQPQEKGTVCFYMEGRWHELRLPASKNDSTADRLDVARLGEHVLAPMLGIEDPRTDANIDFVGGIRGTEELEVLVDQGDAQVAFSMRPTHIEELLDVADAGLLMPPKSTWFEPKLRSGLLVHLFD